MARQKVHIRPRELTKVFNVTGKQKQEPGVSILQRLRTDIAFSISRDRTFCQRKYYLISARAYQVYLLDIADVLE